MADQPIADLIDRLERERGDADRAYNDALTAVDLAICTDDPDSTSALVAHVKRFESLLVQYLQTLTAYIDTKDRSIGGSELRERLALAEQRVAALKRELDTPRPAAPGASATPLADQPFSGTVDSTTYVAFEDAFRGSPQEIRARLDDYLPIFAGANDVVDIGCGRGELLQLLAERGVGARGADINPAMVDLCRSKGLDVEQADALSFLERQTDASLGGLVGIQVVEHMAPAYLMRVLETAYMKMRPGAPLVLETINASCWMAFFETYIRDLTHHHPLHPDTLRYLVRATGFSSVDVQYRQPVREVDRLDRVSVGAGVSGDLAAVVAALNAHADKLNARLFSSMDYAVVARR